MTTMFRKTALALAIVALSSGSAFAGSADTKGGLKIKSDDGNFEGSLGGRIHFDGNFFVDDDDIVGGETDDLFFRRARLTLSGKAYGWKYKFENDFAGQSGDEGSGFKEVWVGTSVGPADMRIGQAKPYRGMEELTSSNEVLFMERPYATATGIYRDQQFTQGLFFDGSGANWTWGAAAYSLSNTDVETEGKGFGGRLTYTPILDKVSVFHIGATVSHDMPGNLAAGTNPCAAAAPETCLRARANPAGRRSTTRTIATGLDDRTAYGLEAAYRNGPFYLQSEYAKSTFNNDAATDVDVTTYYVQGSWIITGQTKPYDSKKGVFKSPQLEGDERALELKARYDYIENDDVTNLEVTQYGIGLNWYYNPSVRFMLEYLDGEDKSVPADLSTIAARVQFSF